MREPSFSATSCVHHRACHPVPSSDGKVSHPERVWCVYKKVTCDDPALKVFQMNPDKFDLVITDMAMPDMSGDKLSAELIKIRPDIPVLLCTGFSGNMSEKKAASLGIKGFLLKPIVIKDLAQKIREGLDTVQS